MKLPLSSSCSLLVASCACLVSNGIHGWTTPSPVGLSTSTVSTMSTTTSSTTKPSSRTRKTQRHYRAFAIESVPMSPVQPRSGRAKHNRHVYDDDGDHVETSAYPSGTGTTTTTRIIRRTIASKRNPGEASVRKIKLSTEPSSSSSSSSTTTTSRRHVRSTATLKSKDRTSGRLLTKPAKQIGLTRAQEIEYSFRIRTYRAAMRLREQIARENKEKRDRGHDIDDCCTETFVAGGDRLKQYGDDQDGGSLAAILERQYHQHYHQHAGCSACSGGVTEIEWANACGTSVVELRRLIHQGQEARQLLVQANTGLVTSIAKKYYQSLKHASNAGNGVGTILTLQDFIQEGNLGLMEAAERYLPDRGTRFSTYATYWIKQRIMRSISDTSRIIRLPQHVHTTLSKISKVRTRMTKLIGREPSIPELAHELEMSIEQVQKYTAEYSRNVVSLELPLRTASFKEDSRTIGDTVACSDVPTPNEKIENDFLKSDLHQVLEHELESHERSVLIHRFGLHDGTCRSIDETSDLMDLSRERVRRIEARALNKLRNPQRNYRLKEYVEQQKTTTGDSKHNSGVGNKNKRASHPEGFFASPRDAQVSASGYEICNSNDDERSRAVTDPFDFGEHMFDFDLPPTKPSRRRSGEPRTRSFSDSADSALGEDMVGAGRLWFF